MEVLRLKHVYILLSRTATAPSRFIHFFTGGAYTHVSIATEPATDKFFSYARRSMRNILNAGLISENTQEKIFAVYPDSPCAIYELSVTEKSYEIIEKLIEYYWANYKKCKYSFVGVIPMLFGIDRRLRFRMTCSQFVALLLSRSQAAALPKAPSLMRPNDFLHIGELKLIYKGTIGNCQFPEAILG